VLILLLMWRNRMSIERLTMKKRAFRILSIDGGGVRGILPIVWLEHLEQQLDKPLHEHFDLIAGSSIGAVIGCAIAAGLPVSEIRKNWQAYADTVFSRSHRMTRSLMNLCAYTGIVPRYQADGMITMLKSVFAGQTLGELKTPVLVLTHNPESVKAEILTTPRHSDLPVWSACRASTAAPVFFKPHNFVHAAQRKTLLDGSLSAINPAVVALSHAMQHIRQQDNGCSIDDIVLASFGTGKRLANRHKPGKTIVAHGKALTNALFFGSMADDHATAGSLLSANNYFRLQTLLPARLEAMDAAEHIDELQQRAVKMLKQGFAFHLQRLADRLQQKACQQQWVEQVCA